MSNVKLIDLYKSYDKNEVIHGVDLEIKSGEFIVFVGPSGCGKSTLLRMIAGLEEITKGTIQIDNQIVNDIVAAERGIAMVFQSYALFPHMTVKENMSFGLKMAKVPKNEIEQRVKEVATVLEINSYLDRLPKQLSGGQRQRVAIGRAIVRNPKVFLFDEPLSNLDAALRVQTRIEIAKLHKQLSTTMIYVTHDQVEAITLADRIVVLNNGMIEQVGSPIELYTSPKNQFVAEFIGSPRMNIIDLNESELVVKNIDIPDQSSKLGIRPEHIVIASSDDSKISGNVRHIENLGEHLLCYIKISTGAEITAKLDVNSKISEGSSIYLNWDRSQTHFFNSSNITIKHN